MQSYRKSHKTFFRKSFIKSPRKSQRKLHRKLHQKSHRKSHRNSQRKLHRTSFRNNFGSDIYGLQTPPVYSGVYPMAQNIISPSNYGDPMNRSIDFPSLLNVTRCFSKTII